MILQFKENKKHFLAKGKLIIIKLRFLRAQII